MILAKNARPTDPEKHWRTYAPKGHEGDFMKWAEHYRTGKALKPEKKTWEAYIDRQARLAARMRGRRFWVILDREIYKLRQRRAALAYVPEGRRSNHSYRETQTLNWLPQNIIDRVLDAHNAPTFDR